MATSINNPWLVPAPAETPPAGSGSDPDDTGPSAPRVARIGQAGIVLAPPDMRLACRDVDPAAARLWWVGVHGGAGESTLQRLVDGSRAGDHAWPVCAPDPVPTVLVARTHASGLQAAQRALAEWAAGGIDVDLLGLVLVADAPGRLPRPLRDLARVVGGGAPRCWQLPWVEAWRLGGPVLDDVPRAARSAVREIGELLPGAAQSNITTGDTR